MTLTPVPAQRSLGRMSKVVKVMTRHTSVTYFVILAGVLSGLAVVRTAPRDMALRATMGK